ncbi:glycyl-tRNA synthetase [Cantharellus anzutake]|uniref:glycyl-tRNA synthetase n=1 Tax=Cantharellus anzutake TaxID=1750568 RepID=UPI001903FA07|nr:glycyl-tRNA synthetase [Cantharellus anzutake]KAF8331498.1 glycyl-tRNA synthetase [Cantharellus anzutake]
MSKTNTTRSVNKTAHPFNRASLEALLNRRFFYAPAFEIYGGIAGLYDYGPPGSSLQANIIAEWRRHFIIQEHMLELDTTILTPSPVFETSGHVARFADWMVKDTKIGEVLRADHLVEGVLEARLKGDKEARGALQEASAVNDKDKKKKKTVKSTAVKLDDAVIAEYENVLAQIDNYTGPELGQLLRKYNITNPTTGNEVDEPVQFNLMFDSSIGPTGKQKGYLRPETAQGHFLNFSRLLDFNNNKLPFASAQIGRSFRNEISPRAGLIRVREFTMAEIEHYVDPLDKSHERFDEAKDIKLRFLPRDVQSRGKTDLIEMSVGEAVEKKIVDNQTLGYFLARVYLYLSRIGIDPARLRFRQHMENEMAHYASDCWDAEIFTSYGWIECVGCADRSAYDLTVHAKKTGAPLVARVALPEPVITEREVATFDKKILGKTFQKDGEALRVHVTELPNDELEIIKDALKTNGSYPVTLPDGRQFSLTSELVTIERRQLKQSIREFTPNVIEPSFGIGRILYALLEHSYWAREQDIQRGVLSLPAVVAPTKVLVVPLSANEKLAPAVAEISSKLRKAGVFSRVDDSTASIGKRYSRNDELGTPYGITIDFATVSNGTVTLRERDTTDQLIGKIDEVTAVVTELVEGSLDWEGACQRLPAYDGVQAID